MTWVPESCTLPVAARPLRVAEFGSLLARAVLDALAQRCATGVDR